MKHFVLFFVFQIVLYQTGLAQNEAFYRNRIVESPEDKQKNKTLLDSFKLEVESKTYRFDIDKDGRPEDIVLGKQDQKDTLKIYSLEKGPLKSLSFLPSGIDSQIYKLSVHELTPTTPLILIHYDQGKVERFSFEATAKLYFLVVPEGDWSKANLHEGPSFFHEKKYEKENYWLRSYQVLVKDYKKDDVNEVSVHFRNTSHIYFYSKNKKSWRRL